MYYFHLAGCFLYACALLLSNDLLGLVQKRGDDSEKVKNAENLAQTMFTSSPMMHLSVMFMRLRSRLASSESELNSSEFCVQDICNKCYEIKCIVKDCVTDIL